MIWWTVLTTVDEIHNYLQFLLPSLIFLTLITIQKSKYIAILGYLISGSFLLVIGLNKIESLNFIQILQILLLILLPLGFYFLGKNLNPNLGKFLEYLGAFSLFCFFATQVIFGGCIIHYYQNILARKHLSIEIWHPVKLFGSEIISSPFLYFLYSFLTIIIFIKLYLQLKSRFDYLDPEIREVMTDLNL